MAKARVHPIQLAYRITSNGAQFCELCGAAERWTARVRPPVSAAVFERSMHLVHLVSTHLADVQESLTPAGKREEVNIDVDG